MPKDARRKILRELDLAPEDRPRVLDGLHRLGGMSNIIGFSLISQQLAAAVVVLVLVFINAVAGVALQGSGFRLASLQGVLQNFARYDTQTGLLQNLLLYVCSMFLPFVLLTYLLRRHPLRVVPVGRIRHAGWLPAAAVVSLGLFFLASLVLAYIEALLGAAHLRVQAPDFAPPSAPGPITLYLVLFCVVAPICEEFIFRGVILHSLRRFGDGFAVVLSALLFAMLHGNIAQLPLAFLLGLAFGFFVLYFKSIWATVLMHGCVNLFSTVIGMSLQSTGDAGNLIYAGIGVALLAAAIATAFVLRRQGRLHRLTAEWSNPGLPATYLLRRAFASPGMIVFTVLTVLLCISGLRFA